MAFAAALPYIISIGGSLLSSYMGKKDTEGGTSNYNDFMAAALANYQAHESQGRSDIEGAYNRGLSYMAPYMGAGYQSLGDYQASLGQGTGIPGSQTSPQGAAEAQQGMVNKFQATPGYQNALQQGANAINQNAAARGLAGSGGTLKALTDYGQAMANQQYGQYQNRLQGLATQGQQASGQAFQGSLQSGNELANLGLNYAQEEGGIYSGVGQGLQSQGNANSIFDTGMISQIMSQLGQYFGKFGNKGATPAAGSAPATPST